MKTISLMLVLLVLSGVVWPDAATAVPEQRAENPCGKVVCCCPHICKKVKEKKLACKIRDRQTCGIKSASPEVSLSPTSLAGLRITIVSQSLADSQPRNSKLPLESCRQFDPADRFPLDKPPPFLS